MNPKTTSLLSITSSLILLTSNASAALFWAPDAMSPNGEFTDGGVVGGPAATTFGSAISYGILTLDNGTQVDYAVKLNDLFDLRHPADGAVAPSGAANNMFAVHPDGSADLYTAINRDGWVDISVCTFDLGTYNPITNMGTPTAVTFGVTAQNYSPNTVMGSDGVLGSDIQRLNNNEQLFSTSPIALIDSANDQVETNGALNNLGTAFTVPAGFSSAFAWEAATGLASYGPDMQLDVSEADFNVTYAPSSVLRLRRDTDRGLNSAFGLAAAATIPEPSRAVLLGLGLVGIVLRRRRK